MYGLSKILITILILTSAICLYAQDTITETILTEKSLQGGIGYHVQNGHYSGGIFPTWSISALVGDIYGMDDTNDISLRLYYSFPINETPANYSIYSVSFNISVYMHW